MDRRRSRTLRVLALTIAGVSLAGCAVHPARPYGYGHGGGYGSRPYAYSAPSWGGRGYGYGHGGGHGGGWGHRGGWR